MSQIRLILGDGIEKMHKLIRIAKERIYDGK